MGKFSFWFLDNGDKNSKGLSIHNKDNTNVYLKTKSKFEKSSDIISKRVNTLLKKYKDNTDVKEEILSVVSMYQTNCSIAIECKSDKSLTRLTKELHRTLNKY